jgi:hypothetical protein
VAVPVDPQLDSIIEAASQQHNLDPMLLRATLMGESRLDPNAVSPLGAEGIAQLMPKTARGLGVSDSFDVNQAIPAAAKYLAEGLNKYGDPEKALMYYHGGPDESIWGPKTQAYPSKIAQHYAALSAPPSGVDALAASRKAVIPAPGQVARNFTPPANTPDTLDAAPPEVAALAALSGQGTAPTPRTAVQPLAGEAQMAQTGVPSYEEFVGLQKAQSPSPAGPSPMMGAGTPAGAVGAAPSGQISPADIKWAQEEVANRTLGKIPVPGWMDEMTKMEPGMPLSPEYQQQIAVNQALAAGRQYYNPATRKVEPIPGTTETDAARAKAVAKGGEQGRADVQNVNELVEATVDLGDGRGPVKMQVPRGALTGQVPMPGQPTGAGMKQTGTPFLPTATTVGFGKLSELDAADVAATRDAANAGRRDLATVRTIQDFLPQVATGWGGETKLEASRILKTLGVGEDKINSFLKTDPAAGQLLTKNFLQLSAGAVRQMGAREPGSVMFLFKDAYPGVPTDEKAITLQTNALYMNQRRQEAEAEEKAKFYGESLTQHQKDPTTYRGLTGFSPEFNKANHPEQYLHAAEAMSNYADKAWAKAKSDEQQTAIYNLIPSGSTYWVPNESRPRVKP